MKRVAQFMKRTSLAVGANALLFFCIFYGSTAVADQFSFKCERVSAGYLGYFTFDDLKRRVVSYNFLNGRIVGLLNKGTIRTISAQEIQFDLVVYSNPNIKIGDFTLNRKEGWMTSSRSNDEDRQTCESTPLRTVMDLWEIFPHDP
jgi:hypothetical protein